MNAATSTETAAPNLFDVLQSRGLVSQCTDEKIADRLAQPVTLYCGFDPTADTPHIGHLMPIMGLAHAQRCGHRPLVLVGGATAMVGDPSGKSEARRMLSTEAIRHNAEFFGRHLSRFITFDDSPAGAVLLNNLDWIAPLSWLDVLRDIGSRVSVNRMLTMESVKQRMAGDGDGITYLEFSYMLLQAYDFVHLFREHGCTLQLAGQDQWGNTVMGIELGRKLHNADLAGLTLPLITKADGKKFGKSESGNVWLDADLTPVFDFFQFWRNVGDADVGRYLRYFTFMPLPEIEALENAQGTAINDAKVTLAYEVTKLVHGPDEAEKARDSAASAFSKTTDFTGESIPSTEIPESELTDDGKLLIQLMIRDSRLATSNGEARRLIKGGGVRINDEKINDIQRKVTLNDVVNGSVVIRVGKKKIFRYDVLLGL